MAKRTKGKVSSRKVVADDGQIFGSEVEYERYKILCEWQRIGLIRGLRRNMSFELLPDIFEDITVQMKTKVKEQRIILFRKEELLVHFVYEEDGIEKYEVVLESSRMPEKVFELKKKLMYFVHNIKVKEYKQ